MPIYTRTGDTGTTGLFGGKRISKADCQIETYGSIDELTSYIGLVAVKSKNKEETDFLVGIQKDLYKIMSYLSGMKIDLRYLTNRTKDFENRIDKLEKKLPKLNRFILPGGIETSAWFQILRVVCRKAERRIIDYFNKKNITNSELQIIKYLNRLSDLFFCLARKYGKNNEVVL